MKFSAAALAVLLVATPASHAFAPQAFGVSNRAKASMHLRTSLPLLSTTIDEGINDITNAELEEMLVNSQKKPANLKEADPKLLKLSAAETRTATADYLQKYKGQSGASVIYSKLVENGVEVVNGFSGGAVLPLLDQFHEGHPRHADLPKAPIRWITNSNESSAGHIAEGYAKSTPMNGKHMPVGVVVATSGPGVTNLITPLQDAICDGVPLVFLCGQAATVAPLDAFQSADAVGLTKPCTKWSYQIKSAAEIPMVMDYAFFIARNGRPGPVFIDLPKDLQNQIVTTELIDSFVEANMNGAETDETSFITLVEKRHSDGELYQAIQLGEKKQGLAFQLAKDAFDEYQLKPVPASKDSDGYHTDHHPTDRIFRSGTFINGKENTLEGELKAGTALTKELIQLIKHAKKPVIIAGQGTNNCPEDLKKFAEKLQIPVCTTLHALGTFDERNNLALNMLGMHGHPTPNFMVQDADLIICIGSRFDDRITGRVSGFVPEARNAQKEGRGGVIHVDIRLSEKAKQIEPTFFVHSTGKKFLQTMNEILEDDDLKPTTGAWLKHMKELQRDFPVKVPHFATAKLASKDADGNEVIVSRTPMSAQSAVSELDKQLLAAGKMDEAIFTTGVGVHQMVAAQLITWTQPRQMLSSGSLGTMGVALGYAVGAQLANKGKIVIAVDGDGSFNMTFTELKTVAEQKIPIKIMIIDNDGQMMVEYWQRLFHDGRLLAVRNSNNPDYSILAQAFGIKSIYCDNAEEMEEKMNNFLFADPGEPVLFHVKVERTPCLPLVAPGQPLGDMILEDVEIDVDGSAAPS
jgi:acetolactate synthase-1/2/3 large subunit